MTKEGCIPTGTVLTGKGYLSSSSPMTQSFSSGGSSSSNNSVSMSIPLFGGLVKADEHTSTSSSSIFGGARSALSHIKINIFGLHNIEQNVANDNLALGEIVLAEFENFLSKMKMRSVNQQGEDV